METLENEIWKPINGYEGRYEMNINGLVKNVKTNKIKTTQINDLGRPYVLIYKDGKPKLIKIHRCLYETFVGPIPKGYDVHHIDHNPQNNSLDNLQLLPMHTHRKIHYEEHLKPICKQAALASAKKLSKTVIQYTLEGEFVAEFESTCDASRQTGINQSHISDVCLCKRKKAGGYVWRYINNGDSNEPPIL